MGAEVGHLPSTLGGGGEVDTFGGRCAKCRLGAQPTLADAWKPDVTEELHHF